MTNLNINASNLESKKLDGYEFWGLDIWQNEEGEEWAIALTEDQAQQAFKSEVMESLHTFHTYFLVGFLDRLDFDKISCIAYKSLENIVFNEFTDSVVSEYAEGEDLAEIEEVEDLLNDEPDCLYGLLEDCINAIKKYGNGTDRFLEDLQDLVKDIGEDDFMELVRIADSRGRFLDCVDECEHYFDELSTDLQQSLIEHYKLDAEGIDGIHAYQRN